MGEIAKQGSRNVVLMYSGAIIGFVNTILLYPKILPKAEYGLISLILSISMLVASISSFGAPNALIRFFPHFRNEEEKSTKRVGEFFSKTLSWCGFSFWAVDACSSRVSVQFI